MCCAFCPGGYSKYLRTGTDPDHSETPSCQASELETRLGTLGAGLTLGTQSLRSPLTPTSRGCAFPCQSPAHAHPGTGFGKWLFSGTARAGLPRLEGWGPKSPGRERQSPLQSLEGSCWAGVDRLGPQQDSVLRPQPRPQPIVHLLCDLQ